LPISYQIPQVAHAVVEFSLQYPEEYKHWHTNSNTLVTLSCKSEKHLCEFSELLENKSVKHIRFFEPDIAYGLTAICLVPSLQAKKLCSNLSLAGKNVDETKEQQKKKWLMETKTLLHELNLQSGLVVKERLLDLLNMIYHPEMPPKFSWRLPTWFFPYAASMRYSLFKKLILERAALLYDLPEDKLEIVLGGEKVDEVSGLLVDLAKANTNYKGLDLKAEIKKLDVEGLKICTKRYGIGGTVK
jgi:hypothetical protein